MATKAAGSATQNTVLHLRISKNRLDALRRKAAELGVPLSVFVRGYLDAASGRCPFCDGELEGEDG